MDTFEKQQTIEGIKTIVKARWFYIPAIVLQGLIVKLIFTGVPLISIPGFSAIALAGFLYNFTYWFYIRRSPEKMSDRGIKIVKALQVVGDQLAISAILYFSGTANKPMMVFYFVTIMIASSLYGKKGILLSLIFSGLLYSALISSEYFGLMPVLSSAAVSQAACFPLRGEYYRAKLVFFSFNMDLIAATFVAGFIASHTRRREKRFVAQREDLVKKTEELTLQTQELTKTKDYLHEALTKSDKARGGLEKAQVEINKTNTELKAKIEELEKFNQVTIGREIKMKELKEKIKDMEDKTEKKQEE